MSCCSGIVLAVVSIVTGDAAAQRVLARYAGAHLHAAVRRRRARRRHQQGEGGRRHLVNGAAGVTW